MSGVTISAPQNGAHVDGQHIANRAPDASGPQTPVVWKGAHKSTRRRDETTLSQTPHLDEQHSTNR